MSDRPHPRPPIDYLNNPPNLGRPEEFTHEGYADYGGSAPRASMYFVVVDGNIELARFAAFGCGHLIACCSAATMLCQGRTIEQCREIQPAHVEFLVGGLPPGRKYCAEIAAAAVGNAFRTDGPSGSSDA
ncbi:MAG: iron-sulfur cluster assembly scaffold protein [Planctomycetales bacterium]|nr:iron-sulfur cluster assembly scaffold protein [Planctomycetales bacterium]